MSDHLSVFPQLFDKLPDSLKEEIIQASLSSIVETAELNDPRWAVLAPAPELRVNGCLALVRGKESGLSALYFVGEVEEAAPLEYLVQARDPHEELEEEFSGIEPPPELTLRPPAPKMVAFRAAPVRKSPPRASGPPALVLPGPDAGPLPRVTMGGVTVLERIALDSSFIDSLYYDPFSRTLTVNIRREDGRIQPYGHQDVSLNTYADFCGAESAGKFYNEHFRKP